MKMFYFYLACLTGSAMFAGSQATMIAVGMGSWDYLFLSTVIATVCGAGISGHAKKPE